VIEVESKYWSPGNSAVISTLNRLGAKKISEMTLEDVYFAHPSREFGKTDEAVRLRKKEDGTELTYKGPRMKTGGPKAREEITVKVDDSLSAQRILERLGFKEIHVIVKKRSAYQLDKLRVDVDVVEGLGEFVEVEVLTESVERAASLVEMARAELGLTKLEPKTYLELLIERKGK
jgi:adenylate cyclase class 2